MALTGLKNIYIFQFTVNQNITIEDEMEEIIFKLTKIMGADKGFLTIRKFRYKEKELYTIGRYKIKMEEIPFELNKEYYTYNFINKQGVWYTFDSPKIEDWKGNEKKNNVQGIIIIRFF